MAEVTSKGYHTVGVALTSVSLADGTHAEAALPTLLNFLGYAKGEDAYYYMGTCSPPLGGTPPPECAGHEGNWTLLRMPAAAGGVGTPRVVKVYDQRFVPGIGNAHAGVSTASRCDANLRTCSFFVAHCSRTSQSTHVSQSGALDAEGGRLTFFSVRAPASQARPREDAAVAKVYVSRPRLLRFALPTGRRHCVPAQHRDGHLLAAGRRAARRRGPRLDGVDGPRGNRALRVVE